MDYAFIFARGGSKGLPGKNIKSLGGKPLIQYSIEVAQKVPSIDKVFVSTDDADIAQIANSLDAIVIDRPPHLADDMSSEWLAWRHAIIYVIEKYGRFGSFISLPATSPLRSEVDVVSAIAKRKEMGADICVGVTPAGCSPYFNMVKVSDDGFIGLVNKPDVRIDRRQDAPQVFDLTTVVYVTSPDFVLNNQGVFSGKVTSIEVPKERAVDIDDIYDFQFAEALFNMSKDR